MEEEIEEETVQEIDVHFDIENYMYLMFRKYLANSKFSPKVVDKAPKELTENILPLVVIRETGNTDRKRSLDRTQRVAQITSTIEIYTKDMVVDSVRYASKTVLSELKYMVFDFFEQVGATRIEATPTEYYNNQIDRYIIVEKYLQNNWNKKLY